MKKLLSLACVLAVLFAMTACGGTQPSVTTDPTPGNTTVASDGSQQATPSTEETIAPPVDTTENSPETSAEPVETPAPDASDSAAPSTTNLPETEVPQPEISLLYGLWKQVGGTASTVIGESEIQEEEGHSVTYPYTVKSTEKNENGDLICVIHANNSDYTYIVYRSAPGYDSYAYLEILTNKTTLKFSRAS